MQAFVDLVLTHPGWAALVALIPILGTWIRFNRLRIAKRDLEIKELDREEKRAKELPPPVDPATYANIDITPDRPVKGRIEERIKLRAALTKNKAAAIVRGTGGMGKTTLARYYIQHHHSEYRGIAFLHCENQPEMETDLRTVAHHFGVQIADATPLRSIAQTVLNAIIATGEPWLVVYDNVEHEKSLVGLTAEGPNLHIVVTSRWGDWPAKFAVQELKTLDAKAAIDLLLTESHRTGDRDGAKRLTDALGYLPLAIVAAGGWLKDNTASFDNYATDLAEAIKVAPTGDYPDSVIGAVKLSYDACSDDARALLDLFAWIATDLIEARLVEDLVENERAQDIASVVPDILNDLAATPARLAAAMTELRRRSLLTGAEEPFTLHRLSAAAIRALQGEDAASDQIAAAAVIAARYPYDSDLHHTWAHCRRLTPHVLALANHEPLPNARSLDWLFNQACIFLRNQAQLDSAIDLAEKSLDIKITLNGADHRATGAGQTQLGNCLSNAGRLEEAEAALAEAVRIGELNPDRKDDLATRYSNHGGVLKDLGRREKAEDRAAADAYYARAKDRYEAALAIGHVIHGPRSRQVGNRLNNLATVHMHMGDRSAAITYARDALAIEKEAEPPNPPSLGYCQSNLGAFLLQNGDLEEAEKLLEAAYKTDSDAYSNPTHPNVIETARWFITALLMRALRGQDADTRTARAHDIAAAHGIDMEEMDVQAKFHLYALKEGIEYEDLIARLIKEQQSSET